jgi:hypothetical protein
MGGSFASALHNPPASALRERGTQLIRVHRLSSLCAGLARFFALTPIPSPTLWERGVGAHGGAPCSAFPPLSQGGERGTKGVRAIQRACPLTLALGKIAPASKTSCRTVVPLPEGTQGVRATRHACSRSRWGKIAPTPKFRAEPLYPYLGRHRGLPLQRCRLVGADLCVCPSIRMLKLYYTAKAITISRWRINPQLPFTPPARTREWSAALRG